MKKKSVNDLKPEGQSLEPTTDGRPAPGILLGRKLPAHSLWQQLQRQGLTLEFCPPFFHDQMSYAQAGKWLASHGIKISRTSLGAFYNSLDMQLRFAALQQAQLAKTAKTQLPADLDQAARECIAQHKFILASRNLDSKQRLQLIKLQQNQDAIQGNLELKRARQKTYARWIAVLVRKNSPKKPEKVSKEVWALNEANRQAVLDAVDEVMGIPKGHVLPPGSYVPSHLSTAQPPNPNPDATPQTPDPKPKTPLDPGQPMSTHVNPC